MYTFILILIVVVCVLLALVVLIQNSKGGGLAANFSAPQQVLGARGTTDFIEKATWILAGALLVLCLLAAAFMPNKSKGDDELKSDVEVENVVNDNAPAAPVADPQTTATPIPDNQ